MIDGIYMNKVSVIAIDGPAGSGKSSVATMVAQKLDAPYVNTGSMYRAITLFLQNAKVDISNLKDQDVCVYLEQIKISYEKNPEGEWDIKLNGRFPGEELRAPVVADAVSSVAAIPAVRNFLKQIQRDSAELGRIVMEGRDIGTVIFPNAKWKFFLWATPEERARRRLAQDKDNFAGLLWIRSLPTSPNATGKTPPGQLLRLNRLKMLKKSTQPV